MLEIVIHLLDMVLRMLQFNKIGICDLCLDLRWFNERVNGWKVLLRKAGVLSANSLNRSRFHSSAFEKCPVEY